MVTAQKRKEQLQKVPISISVLRGDDLDRSTAEGLTEALNRVPGVTTTISAQGGGTQLAVRGVTAAGPLFFGSSPIAYYLDSVPFGLVRSAIVPDSNAYDLERVEVLRGPQGTLYGASALNGVVRVLTHDADLNEFEFKARTSASGTDGGGGNYRGDMAVNVPIVAGKLAARAVVGYQNLSGWIDKPNDKDANHAELRNFRLKINAQPTDKLSIGLSAWRSQDDYGMYPGSNDGRTNPNLLQEPISTVYDAYGLNIGYELPGFSVTSMTSYLDYDNRSYADLTQIGLNIRQFNGEEAKVFSQEVVLHSTHDGPWRWTAGGLYRREKSPADPSYYYTLGNTSVLFAPFGPPYAQRTISKSFAGYGELTRLFFDGQLELTGGLRNFDDEVTNAEGPLGEATLSSTTRNFHALTPRAVLTWHPSDQLTTYASYGKGFRSGFSQVLHVRAATDLPPVKPDTLKNYELGAKGSLWGGRVNFDTALYDIKWHGVQQSLVVVVDQIPYAGELNAGDASGIGFDFGLTTKPVERLELGINFNWNDLTFDTPVYSNGVLLFGKGDRLNSSPEYTIGGSVAYAFPLGGNGFEGRFSAAANYTSKMETRSISGVLLSNVLGDPMLIGRTSFSIDSPDHHWASTIFVDNVNNERGTPTGVQGPLPLAMRVRPRTIGVQIDYRL